MVTLRVCLRGKFQTHPWFWHVGNITVDHAKDLLRKNGQGGSDEELMSIIDTLDPNSSGVIARNALIDVLTTESECSAAEPQTTSVPPADELNALKKVLFFVCARACLII